MNLFFLHDDPRQAARDHADKHVGKMLLEACQMMSTAVRKHGFDGGYASAYVNHPMTKWVGQSYEHADWTLTYATELAKEFVHRYGHSHKSTFLLPTLSMAIAEVMPSRGWRNPPRCMPNEYKIDYDTYAGDVPCHVASYRDYYRDAKSHIHKWTNRPIPTWI